MDVVSSYLLNVSEAMLVAIGLPLILGTLVELLYGSRPFQHLRRLCFNVSCSVLLIVLSPVSAAGSIAMINRLGGGLIDITSMTGWRFGGSAILFIVVMDLAEYLFHRAQHAWPVLWAMHSLHHSDEAMNVTTTGRHYWVEPAIKAVTVYPLVGLLLVPDAGVFSVYFLASFYHYASHLNVRVSFGRCSWILNAPQYHRLHHSCLPEHHDVNFAALLPIFDVLSGAYRRPLTDEYPTGVTPRDVPSGLGDALIWPVRRRDPVDWLIPGDKQARGTSTAQL